MQGKGRANQGLGREETQKVPKSSCLWIRVNDSRAVYALISLSSVILSPARIVPTRCAKSSPAKTDSKKENRIERKIDESADYDNPVVVEASW